MSSPITNSQLKKATYFLDGFHFKPDEATKPEVASKAAAAQDANNVGDSTSDFVIVDDLPGAELLRSSTVEKLPADNRLLNDLKAHSSVRKTALNVVKDFFRAAGRRIMGICSAIRGLFSSAPVAEGLVDMNRRLDVTGRGTAKATETDMSKAASYSDEEIGAAFGLKGQIVRKEFEAKEIQEIRDGKFSLDDIRQDPSFQDCWFLSSLASVMVAKGARAVASLIQIPNPDEGFAYVRLGSKSVYKVPLGEICGDTGSTKSVSDSKPWVKLLETAMQMHMIKDTIGLDGEQRGDPTMGPGHPQEALNAFLDAMGGYDEVQSFEVGKNDIRNEKDMFDVVCKGLRNHHPVVLGTPHSNLVALGSGISPDHAVTVLDAYTADGARISDGAQVQDAAPGYLLVQDPYGKTKIVSASILSKATVSVECLHRPRLDSVFDTTDRTTIADAVKAELKSCGLGSDDSFKGFEAWYKALGDDALDAHMYGLEDRRSKKTMVESLVAAYSASLADAQEAELSEPAVASDEPVQNADEPKSAKGPSGTQYNANNASLPDARDLMDRLERTELKGKHLQIVNNSGQGNNCLFFSTLAGLGQDLETDAAEAMREIIGGEIREFVEQACKDRGLNFETVMRQDAALLMDSHEDLYNPVHMLQENMFKPGLGIMADVAAIPFLASYVKRPIVLVKEKTTAEVVGHDKVGMPVYGPHKLRYETVAGKSVRSAPEVIRYDPSDPNDPAQDPIYIYYNGSNHFAALIEE